MNDKYRILGDLHTHTIASQHAYSTIGELVDQSKKLGMEFLAVTDHGPEMLDGAIRHHFYCMPGLPEVVDGIRLYKGAEVNIKSFEGRLDLDDEVLSRLDFIIASYHVEAISPGSEEENTKGWLNAIRNKYVDCLGHTGNPAYPFNHEKIEDNVTKVAKVFSKSAFCIILFAVFQNTFLRFGFIADASSTKKTPAAISRRRLCRSECRAAAPLGRGAASASARSFCGIKLHVLPVRPQFFEAIEHSGVVVEDVHDDTAEVQHRPLPFPHAVAAQHGHAVFLHLLFDIFGKRFHLFVAARRADDEVVGKDGEVRDVEHGDVHRFPLVELFTDRVFDFFGIHLFSLSCAKAPFSFSYYSAASCGR